MQHTLTMPDRISMHSGILRSILTDLLALCLMRVERWMQHVRHFDATNAIYRAMFVAVRAYVHGVYGLLLERLQRGHL